MAASLWRASRFTSLVVMIALLGTLAACGADDAGSAGGREELTVAAAADLQGAFTEIGAAFERQKGITVRFTFGSTGNLATQIQGGAPFDVFAAANVTHVDALIADGALIADSKRLYAIGRIVLASNKASGLDLQRLEDLTDERIRWIAIANPDHAPYGVAAKEALQRVGLWDALQPKILLGENVRQTLQYIELGEAEAGIVALSIADVPDVTYVLIDDELHSPLVQAIAVVAGSGHERAAREFIAFVTGAEGRAILQRYGFGMPD